MSLSNVIVISRQAELQQLSCQIADTVFAADNCPEAEEILQRTCPELILFDQWTDREQVVQCVDKLDKPIPIVAISNKTRQDPCVVRFLDNQHCHYVEGVQDVHTLQRIVHKIKSKRVSYGDSSLKEAFYSSEAAAAASFVGTSVSARHTLKMIRLVGASQCNPILIVGEMGTGKEVAAKAIHLQRAPGKEFIAVNCASLSENLLESELFGHEKGAFTSADREKTGLLELAGDGCIFLDEISEVPLALQAKLLRVIQEKTFRRVGGTCEITCRATIIASSNRDLKQEVEAKRFRGDLYHRLTIFPIVLGALRDPSRRSDIRLLAEYFLMSQTICPEKTGIVKSFTNLAMEALEKYHWPGNIRELRNVVERAVLLESSDKIGLNSIVINPEDPQEFIEQDRGDKVKDYSLAKAEQELIARVLKETNWQKTKAAEMLGISRATLYAKVKQHNLTTGPEDSSTEKVGISKSFSESQAVAI